MAGLLQAVKGAVGSFVTLIREDGQAEDCELVAPGGGASSFDPIQKTLWLDPAAAPATPNGSIAAPFQTFAAAIAVIAADPTGEWEIALPSAVLALGNQAVPLVGVQTLVLQGIDRTATNLGNFAPNETDSPSPRYVYRNLTVGTLHYRVPTDTWARQSFEDVQITTLTLDAGGTWSELAFDGCTVVTTAAGSVDVQLTYRNCTLGAMLTSSGVSFDGCTFLPGVTLQLDGGATFLGCTFGAGVIVGSPVSMDRESEVSLLEHGGSLALVTSLDGWGVAQPTPDSNADIDFSTFITRAYLEATKLTGNVTKNVTNTGTTKDGQIYVFENYNTTGFTCTLGYSEGVGSTTFVVGTERVRLVFRYDGVADGVFLQSWAKIGDT